MKKILLAICSLLIAICILSCNKTSIEGTWIDEDGYTVIFKDGIFYEIAGDYSSETPYTIEGNNFTLIYEHGTYSYTFILNDNKLTFTGEGGEVILLTREDKEAKTEQAPVWDDGDIMNACEALAAMMREPMKNDRMINFLFVDEFKNESSERIDTSRIPFFMKLNVDTIGENFLIVNEDDIADYVLSGSVRTVVDTQGNKATRTYIISAEVHDVKNNLLKWRGQHRVIKSP